MTVAHLNGHMTAASPLADLDPKVSHPELRVERDLAGAPVPNRKEANQGTESAAAPDRDAAFRAFIASVGSPLVSPYPVVSAHDLLTRVPAQETPNFLVEGILPAGELVILDAKPKAGKGLISIDLLCSVARGEPFLGMKVRQDGALYVAADERAEEIAFRLRQRLGVAYAADLKFGVLDASGFGERTLRLEDSGYVASLAETMLCHGGWPWISSEPGGAWIPDS